MMVNDEEELSAADQAQFTQLLGMTLIAVCKHLCKTLDRMESTAAEDKDSFVAYPVGDPRNAAFFEMSQLMMAKACEVMRVKLNGFSEQVSRKIGETRLRKLCSQGCDES